MDKRIHVYYSGIVQGVGFRFTAERIAQQARLCGYVRNLDDGRVEVVCEGSEASLGDFLSRVQQIFDGQIRDTNVERQNATGEFNGFDIRF